MPYHIDLREPLRSKDMTIRAIAEESGVHVNTVSKYMNSTRDTDTLPDAVPKLAKWLGYDPNKLEGWATYYDEDAESPETQNVTPEMAA